MAPICAKDIISCTHGYRKAKQDLVSSFGGDLVDFIGLRGGGGFVSFVKKVTKIANSISMSTVYLCPGNKEKQCLGPNAET